MPNTHEMFRSDSQSKLQFIWQDFIKLKTFHRGAGLPNKCRLTT